MPLNPNVMAAQVIQAMIDAFANTPPTPGTSQATAITAMCKAICEHITTNAVVTTPGVMNGSATGIGRIT